MTSCSSAMSNFHQDHNLKTRHSFYGGETPRDSLHSGSSWKSDVNVPESAPKCRKNTCRRSDFKNVDSAEYYKRYEHDEIPVKDDSNKVIISSRDSDQPSLTNSDLEKLENKIYKNISQELQTDDSSISSLESNIKFFKTTVQEIFDNFYTSMQDFELYKKRFEEILAKNREDSIADMEDFIKDMIHHIMSSDSCLSSESRKWVEMTNLEIQDKVDSCHSSAASEKQTAKLLESLHSVVEAYKNENYLTDSTFDDNPSKQTNSTKKEEIFNIYLLSGAPYVQIKMNERHLLSEINIKDVGRQETEYHVASAENLKKLAAKKLELEKYVRQQQESQAPDREIPVKISFAKKNIHLNEDFANDRDKDDNKSLMSKICSYICKKFRKN
ncbi:uncharacterized protein LOC135074320 [Ostrinia nubilalis]|uniref:uncharacterized protein LOC135074320 n=1 Tax=Ostrinia nubilalis TaxID=29057 RepID=UPI0030823FA0